ncbi:cytoskeletal protein binding protein, partial [Rhizopus stolonifer]
MKYVAICKALYEYKAQNHQELSFNTDDILYILENSDPDWYKAQLKTPPEQDVGPIGLVPSNYIEKIHSIGTVKALYDYNAQSVEEVSFKENETLSLYEKDDPDCTDWWTIQHKDGSSGIVPATYVKFQQDNSDKRVQEAERKRLEEQKRQELEIKRKQDYEIRDRERQRELQEINRQRELEQKERERQAEMDRRRKLQEEAKQKEIEAKRQAAASTNSPQLGSPRRSQIPAPPPPSTHTDPTKPDPAKVRLWTDRTGAFKVEAQLLLCANGKIRLFKTNGVKIDVPTEKMCIEDLRYIEQETGLKLTDDNIPLAQLTRFNWFDYFK